MRLKFAFFHILVFFLITNAIAQNNVTAIVNTSAKTAVLDNGIIRVGIDSRGRVTSLKKFGHEVINSGNGGRIYFSYNDLDGYHELSPSGVKLAQETDELVEVIFSNASGKLGVEQGYILKKGESGLYSYIVLKGTRYEVTLREMRVVYRVDPEQFTYGFVTDQMQGELPSVDIMKQVNDNSIMDATYPLPDGTIYTKYNWANYIDDDSVHGLMADTLGVWAINPSNEYINGGPLRQELTVHTTNKTPLALQMLQGEHFGAAAQVYKPQDAKIYGPFFFYINNGESKEEMIEDARKQAGIQKGLWPYQWMHHNLYPTNRTVVKGKINLPFGLSPENLQVVLAKPGEEIYNQGKDYIFWSKTDANGAFSIRSVREGNYTLYAFSTGGEITDKFALDGISVSGSELNLGDINWVPVKYKHLLWQIGENNRKTTGFRMANLPRKYGLYETPSANLTYNVGRSDPERNWYYAQTKKGSWKINFELDSTYTGMATLTASIAGATSNPTIYSVINNRKGIKWNFGNDAAIYRSAVLGGRHQVVTFAFDASFLKQGINTLELQLQDVGSRGGVLYDYIKLEVGEQMEPNVSSNQTIATGIPIKCFPNPITNKANIEIFNPITQTFKVDVLDLNGKVMEQLHSGKMEHGQKSIIWHPHNIPAGIYMIRIETENFRQTHCVVKK